MKITICGSIAFIDEMVEAKCRLEEMGHEVQMPPTEIVDGAGAAIPAKQYYHFRKTTTQIDGWIWDRKEEAMRNHFNKVVWADAILVLNHDKNKVVGYIGANTLLEMGLAFHHGKRIYLFGPIPQLPYKEEILGMKPIAIDTDLSRIV